MQPLWEKVSASHLTQCISPALMVGKRIMSLRSWLTTGLDREYSPWRLIPRWNWTQLASSRSCRGASLEVMLSCSLYILCRLKEQGEFCFVSTGGYEKCKGLPKPLFWTLSSFFHSFNSSSQHLLCTWFYAELRIPWGTKQAYVFLALKGLII